MLRRSDFDGFASWYSLRHQRKHGAPPAENTLRTKRGYLAIAANAAQAGEERDLATLLPDRQALDNLLDSLAARLSPAAFTQVYFSLKPFGEYAKAQGWITHSELRPEDKPSHLPEKPITVYTPDEMQTFVTAARGVGLRWWVFLSFLTETGRRVGETLSLEWAWFNQDAAPPYFGMPTSKNGQQQYVPLTKRLRADVFTPENVAALRGEPQGRKGRSPEWYVFPWTYNAAHRMFDRFCDRTGLPNRGFHNFRHTVITDRLAKGVPLQAVSTLAGHRTPAITMRRYAHATALDYARYLD